MLCIVLIEPDTQVPQRHKSNAFDSSIDAGDQSPAVSAAKDAINRLTLSVFQLHSCCRCNGFIECGVGPVQICTLIEITALPAPSSARMGEVGMEVKVEWVHPACHFVINEATVALSRTSHNSRWKGDLLEQHTLLTDDVALRGVSDDENAIATLADAISHALLLGDDVHITKACVQPEGVLMNVMLQPGGVPGNAHKPWFSMEMTVNWGNGSSVSGTALVTLTKHGSWDATVGEIKTATAHNELEVALLYDVGLSDAAKSALNKANLYTELLPGSGGVTVLRLDAASAAVVPATAFTKSLGHQGAPQAVLWRLTGQWAHPSCTCFALQKAIITCSGKFLVGWDSLNRSWSVELESQMADVNTDQHRQSIARRLTCVKNLQDLSKELIAAHNELKVPALDEFRLSEISTPRVVMGEGLGYASPKECNEALVWISVDTAVWTLTSSAFPTLGRFAVKMRFQREQRWVEGGWSKPTWQVSLLGIESPSVSGLFESECGVLQQDKELIACMTNAFQSCNMLRILRVEQVTLVRATPVMSALDCMQWHLQAEWSSSREDEPICSAVAYAYYRDDAWVFDISWLGIKINTDQLSEMTQKRMGCDGGTFSKVTPR